VRIVAIFPNPANPNENLSREWNSGFWVDGPQEEDDRYDGDSDGDNMPDDWERRCDLIVGQNDAKVDNDKDGLANITELEVGTSPCRPDTDRGGEMDGSEVEGGRNPLYAPDDNASKVTGITLRPLNQRIAIGWSQRPDTHTDVWICLSDVMGDLGRCQAMGTRGDFILNQLTNGMTYYLTLFGEGEGGARGAYSDQMPVTPKEDPIPPQGAFFIGGPTVVDGGDVAIAREVVLYADAVDTDSEFEGPAGLGSHSIPHSLVGPEFKGMFAASNDVEMRFANAAEEIDDAPWEPLAEMKAWQLDCDEESICTVFGQFRDGAGNESLIVDQKILLQPQDRKNYLPIVRSN
jgi:hypothetical protein